jgi:hypothetical protein
MSKERRKHVRKRVNLDAALVLSGSEVTQGIVRDMSLGGAFVTLEPTPPFGTSLDITFTLGGEPITVASTVRWSKAGGVGVQFGLIGARHTYLITEHLATAEPTPDTRHPPASDMPTDE